MCAHTHTHTHIRIHISLSLARALHLSPERTSPMEAMLESCSPRRAHSKASPRSTPLNPRRDATAPLHTSATPGISASAPCRHRSCSRPRTPSAHSCLPVAARRSSTLGAGDINERWRLFACVGAECPRLQSLSSALTARCSSIDFWLPSSSSSSLSSSSSSSSASEVPSSGGAWSRPRCCAICCICIFKKLFSRWSISTCNVSRGALAVSLSLPLSLSLSLSLRAPSPACALLGSLSSSSYRPAAAWCPPVSAAMCCNSSTVRPSMPSIVFFRAGGVLSERCACASARAMFRSPNDPVPDCIPSLRSARCVDAHSRSRSL